MCSEGSFGVLLCDSSLFERYVRVIAKTTTAKKVNPKGNAQALHPYRTWLFVCVLDARMYLEVLQMYGVHRVHHKSLAIR